MPDESQTEALLTQLSFWHMGAIILAVVFLIVGLRLILKKPPAHLTAFSGDVGTVLVSRKALQELIKQACLLDDWVEAARPVVKVKASKVSSNVELRLSSPENLKDVCERVQNRITELLQKSLSFDQIGDIRIVVKSFGSNVEDSKQNLELLEAADERLSDLTPSHQESNDTPEEALEPASDDIEPNSDTPPADDPRDSDAK